MEDSVKMKSGGGYAKAVDRTFSGEVGSRAVRMCKAGRFTDYVGKFLTIAYDNAKDV
jgi:hypothetical protein